MALLLLAEAVMPCPFAVATVDHGLRPESEAEARSVATFCSARGIRHTLLKLDLPSGAALQERARKARYAILGQWAASNDLAGIVTAHHADDQAETLLMRLSRGAGVRGLAGMRPLSPVPGCADSVLLRPLLSWRRKELAEIVAAAGAEAVADPSNRDPRYERARVRLALEELPYLDPAFIAASASHLAEADAALEWAAETALASLEPQGATVHWTPGNTPRAITLRVLERILVMLSRHAPRGAALARWHDRLAAGEVATLAGVRGDGRKATWRFSIAPTPRQPP